MSKTPESPTYAATQGHPPFLSWLFPFLLGVCYFLVSCAYPFGTDSEPVTQIDTSPTVPLSAGQTEPVLSDGDGLTNSSAVAAPVGSVELAAGVGYVGEIQAVHRIPVLADISGTVVEVRDAIGAQMKAGTVLARIDSRMLEASRAQALADLESAQANLDLLLLTPSETDIEAARATVSAADAAYKRALEGPSAEELDLSEARIRQAEAAVKRAQAAYDQVSWNPLVTALPESLQLEQATLNLQAAQLEHAALLKGASADVVAAAYARLAEERARLRRLEDGPEPAQVRAAEAAVRQAETKLYLAQLDLDKTSIRAPIDGVVGDFHVAVGETVVPGTPVALMLSPDLQITIAVEETRMPDLRVDDPVLISTPAYPGRTFQGKITTIAPAIDSASHTLPVTIVPLEGHDELSPGMVASVELAQ